MGSLLSPFSAQLDALKAWYPIPSSIQDIQPPRVWGRGLVRELIESEELKLSEKGNRNLSRSRFAES